MISGIARILARASETRSEACQLLANPIDDYAAIGPQNAVVMRSAPVFKNLFPITFVQGASPHSKQLFQGIQNLGAGSRERDGLD